MFQTKTFIQIFLFSSFLNLAFSYTATEVNSCIVSTECKTQLSACKNATDCNGLYDKWTSCLSNETEKKSLSNTTKVAICDFLNNTEISQELNIDCSTKCINALEANNTLFSDLKKCANFCFGVLDDSSIPTTFTSETTIQYKDLYTFSAEEVDQCISTKNTSECSSLLTACEADTTCKIQNQKLSTCLDKNTYCSHKYSDSSNDPKQRVSCPSNCVIDITYEKFTAFDKLLQCFSYCYGYQDAIYFPTKTSLDQYNTLKKEAQTYLPSIVSSCINAECNSSLTKCVAENTCKNSYTLFSKCLDNTTLCNIDQSNSSSKLWNICPERCSNNISKSALNEFVLNCYQYCYGAEFDDNIFEPADKSLVQYEELYGYTEKKSESQSFDISSATYLFCSDLSRCKGERQAIGSAVFILYLVYILFYILNLNRKLNEKQFYYLESFLFIFGFSALMSVNYIQSGIFHAIFCYLTFICLLLIFASTIEGYPVCESLNTQRKFLWLATLFFLVAWNLGNVANYYHVGHNHVE